MARKRSHPVDKPKEALLLTGSAAHERALQAADAAWTKATDDANKAYDMGMSSAWQRYISALKAHGPKPSGGTDFSKKYDQEREIVLKNYHTACTSADKKLERTKNAIEGDLEPIDESE
jgi:hypothetical protein